MNLTCYHDLYISAIWEKKKDSMIQKLMIGKLKPRVYLVTLSQGNQNHLEFFSSVLLKQHVFEQASLLVVGIADGYEEAMHLVEDITRDVLKQTGSTDIRSYIENRQKSFEEGRAL